MRRACREVAAPAGGGQLVHLPRDLVRRHGDDAFSAVGHERQREGVVAGEDGEAGAAGRAGSP